MNNKYPRLGDFRRSPDWSKGGLPCIVCGTPTTGKVDVQVNNFRGDDEVLRVCNAHQKGNRTEVLLIATKILKTKGYDFPELKNGYDFHELKLQE